MYISIILLLVLVGAAMVSSNIFGLFSDKSLEAADSDYPDWPVFNIQKEITNPKDHKFAVGDVLNFKITVTGTNNAEFQLTDQILGMSDDDKGTDCIPSNPNPSADMNNNRIIWPTASFDSNQVTYKYSCTLTRGSSGDYADDLPEVVVGQTTLTHDYAPSDGSGSYSLEYYGGTRGNEAIINYLSDDPLGFDVDALQEADCYTDSSKECFILTPSGTMFFIIHGRSYVGNVAVSDLASLVYPPGMITGDTYNIDPSNFYYFGKNLQQNPSPDCSGFECATWVVSGSDIIEGVQSYYDSDSGFLTNYQENLLAESESISSPRSKLSSELRWYLTAENLSEFNNSDSSNYPDGKVWSIDGNFTINFPVGRPAHEYSGIGTIFVDGNLTIKEDILAKNQSEDFLGLIVDGDVKIEDGADVNAAIICSGTLSTSGSSRAKLTGSFVADDFNFRTAGTEIQYRVGLENHWPPGFRYIKMPIPEKTY